MSNADKRTVATDALATLGTIIGDAEKRDAIHLAVEPVVAGEWLCPGEHVTIENGVAVGTADGQGLGIVDPFLTEKVKKGQRFWLVIYPRMIHSLRHVWTHPAFTDSDGVATATQPEVNGKTVAEVWLRSYADDLDIGFNDLVQAAGYWLESEEYLVRGGLLEGQYTSDEFWVQYAAFTGKEVPADKRGNFFSCSC